MVSHPFLIDKDICLYIKQVEESYPSYNSDDIEPTIHVKRQYYNTHCEYFKQLYPSDAQKVQRKDMFIKSQEGHLIPVRHYYSQKSKKDLSLSRLTKLASQDSKGKTSAVMYFHGGGFIVGDLETHDDICAEFHQHSGVDVFAVDYRLSPEYIYPAALHDCRDAFLHLAKSYNTIVLAGDSAGAMLAAQLSLMVRDETLGTIKGLVLIYPALGGDTRKGSYIQMANAPLLTTEDCLRYGEYYTGKKDISQDLYFCPLRVDNLCDLPSTALFAAGIDPLCDDAIHYATRLRHAGIDDIYLRVDEQLVHAYLRARHMSVLVSEAFRDIVKWMRYYALEKD